jgi:uncharacterized membrane protein YbhN (UPF0104 family)
VYLAIGEPLKKNQLIVGLVILVVFVTAGIYAQHRYHFNWQEVIAQLKQADWRKIGIATGCIYPAYAFRSGRWAYLLRRSKKVVFTTRNAGHWIYGSRSVWKNRGSCASLPGCKEDRITCR